MTSSCPLTLLMLIQWVLEYLYSNFQSIFFQMYGNISIKCLPGINEQAKIFLRIAFSSAGESETYEDPHFVTIMQLIASRMSVSHWRSWHSGWSDAECILFPVLLHPVYAKQTRQMSKVKQNKQSIAVRKHASPLREVTCHTGSHSVTCRPAVVTFPPLRQPIKAGTRFGDPGEMQGWVDLVGWLHTEVVYPSRYGHPSKY